MKKCLFIMLTMIAALASHAQLQDRIWIFGRPFTGSTNATLYFGNPANPVTALPCGQPSQVTVNNGSEMWAVATNPTTGNLIFYTDGVNVFDKFHNLIDIDPAVPGYESLGASVSSCQPVTLSLVPGAGGSSFYIFSNPTGGFASGYELGPITYRLFNTITEQFGPTLNLPGPYGMQDVTEGMKIIPCETDDKVLWLITSLYSPSTSGQNRYVVYKINQSVVTYQGFVDMGPLKYPLPGGPSPIIDITYSEMNTAVGVSRVGFSTQYTSSVFVCDFDNSTGQFQTSTLKTFLTPFTNIPSVYNLEFSPSGRFLYYSVYYTTATTNNLYQIDLLNTPLTSVLVHQFSARYAGGLKMAPDGLVYHIHDCGFLSDTIHLGRILQPDVPYVPGVTVFNQFYQQNFQKYPHITGTSMCEFLCLPTVFTGVDADAVEADRLRLYPNPASGVLYIDGLTQATAARVFDLNGKLLLSQPLTKGQLDVSSLATGMYFLQLSSASGSLTRKFVKE